MTMISIGGVIGGGLFVGSGAVISSTGPGAIFSYITVGILIILIMRMLGEMATVYPVSGSFSTYAHEEIGPWAGYTIGWLYWFFWAIVIPIEALIGADIIHGWVPFIPVAALTFIIIGLLTLTNIYSAKMFGEFEYWFAMIKVAAIVLFLVLGILIILGLIPSINSPGVSNLLERGGLFPNGITPVLISMTIVFFAFPGAEVVTIAAAESPNPKKSVMVAINSVVWRILVFYIGSVFMLVTLLPWNSSSLLKSPFVTVLNMLGIPAAAEIMNIIVLVAVLSCLNSGIYTASRMLYSLSQKAEAPSIFLKVNRRGAPIWAILGSIIFSCTCVVLSFVSADKLFYFLVNASGAIMLLVYLVITFTHLRMRKRLERENPEALVIRMWMFPYLTYITIVALMGILISMAFMGSTRSQVFLTLVITVLILGSFLFVKSKTVQNPANQRGSELLQKEEKKV
ncbi:amino acid permease [Aneurinibacillus terranovensis]|uniref:amino acid permease n=1 Tax=Aneurinibacillus terranovensis TaxID=278991 RepID=UPI0006878A9C|nr:amino acid permease [Aneurinibacillus terranovensis]